MVLLDDLTLLLLGLLPVALAHPADDRILPLPSVTHLLVPSAVTAASSFEGISQGDQSMRPLDTLPHDHTSCKL